MAVPGDRSKPKEKRLEQKENLEAETQRALAVVEAKKAHKSIEEVEKERKRPILISICQRIDEALSSLSYESIRLYVDERFANSPLVSTLLTSNLNSMFEIYESIRFDFQKTMDINENDMCKLFPRTTKDMTSGYHAFACLSSVNRQLKQMKIYCQRMFL